MAQYKIIHGRIKTAAGWFGAADQLNDSKEPLESVIELDDKERKAMDPDGKSLQLLSEWSKNDAGEKAKLAAIEKLEAEEKAKADAEAKAKADSEAKAKAAKGGGK